jgi:dehydrogenase/reductase SDR family protein 12
MCLLLNIFAGAAKSHFHILVRFTQYSKAKKAKVDMGSAYSTGYAKFATVQWYREGSALYGADGFAAAQATFRDSDLPAGCMTGRVVAITGSNQGIGFSAAVGCAKLGAEVHLLCRDASRCAEAATKIRSLVPNAAAQVVCHTLDVSEFDAVRRFAAEFSRSLGGTKKLDVLINNAGCMPTSLSLTKFASHEAITACTFGGCFLLTGLLLPLMTPQSRVVNVSSAGQYCVAPRVIDLDFTFGSDDKAAQAKAYDGTLYYAYAKKHQVMLTEHMNKVLRGGAASQAPTFHVMHPGWATTEAVKTAMPDFYERNKATLRTPEAGADTIVYLAGSPSVASDAGGGFWFDRKRVRTDMPHIPGISVTSTAATDAQREALFKLVYDYVGGEIPAFKSLV